MTVEQLEGGVMLRYRVNVSRSVKGVHTYDCTVELTEAPLNGNWDQAVLTRSDALVQALEERYPLEGS
jgi:hypothetical protein